MRLVVIESPYAASGNANVEEHLTYARVCMADCLMRGEAPFASHLLYTQEDILDDDDPDERRLGIEAGLAWGERADAVVVYIDLGISTGMRYGIERATKRGTPVEYRSIAEEGSAWSVTVGGEE